MRFNNAHLPVGDGLHMAPSRSDHHQSLRHTPTLPSWASLRTPTWAALLVTPTDLGHPIPLPLRVVPHHVGELTGNGVPAPLCDDGVCPDWACFAGQAPSVSATRWSFTCQKSEGHIVTAQNKCKHKHVRSQPHVEQTLKP